MNLMGVGKYMCGKFYHIYWLNFHDGKLGKKKKTLDNYKFYTKTLFSCDALEVHSLSFSHHKVY